MKPKKERVTVTVDRALLDAANADIAAGRSSSLSAWVNEGLIAHAAKARRLAAMAQLIKEYEAEHGAMTDEEIAAQLRADRRGAIVVRGQGTRASDARAKYVHSRERDDRPPRSAKPRKRRSA